MAQMIDLPAQSPSQPEVLAYIKELGLGPSAAKAFTVLCDAGCPAKPLAYLVDRWAIENPVAQLKSRTIHVCPLDDWTTALDGFSKRDLRSLLDQLKRHAKALERLAGKVSKLQATHLFKRMYQDGEFRPDAHLLALAANMEDYADVLMPKIMKACGDIGPRRQPERNQLLLRLVRYVKDCTRRPHHQEISDVLSHFEPMRIGTLKKILSRQGFTGRK